MIADIHQRATHRSKIIAGQIAGLQKMIDNEAYCIDILTQSLAIQRSLGSLDKLVLENHMRTHIVDMMGSGDAKQQEKALAELLDLYKLHNSKGQAADDGHAAAC